MSDVTFTFVAPGLYGDTRIPFDPRKKIPDWANEGRLTDLLTLYHRDCDADGRCWIEGVDGEYVRPPQH